MNFVRCETCGFRGFCFYKRFRELSDQTLSSEKRGKVRLREGGEIGQVISYLHVPWVFAFQPSHPQVPQKALGVDFQSIFVPT